MELEAGGRRRAVNVRRVAGASEVTIDGRVLVVNAVRAGDRWSMLIGDAAAAAPGTGDASVGGSAVRAPRSYDVSIARRSPGELAVTVNGTVVVVGVDRRLPRSLRPGGSGAPGVIVVAAPMAGRVVRVLVKVGDVVTANQPLVVVEAMKMENELRSPRAGTVVDVRVGEGLLVEAKTVLVVVDSAEALPQGS